MVLWFLFLCVSVHAESIGHPVPPLDIPGSSEFAVPIPAENYNDVVDAARGLDPVAAELLCIDSKNPDVGTMSADVQGTQSRMIKIFSPGLEAAFKKYRFSDAERLMFYAQMFAETGGLVNTTELKRPVTTMTISTAGSSASGLAAVEQGLRAKIGGTDEYFKGRGLIQLTRCDNYVSAVHAMDLQAKGGFPQWDQAWIFPFSADQVNAGCNLPGTKQECESQGLSKGCSRERIIRSCRREQLGETCTKEQLDRFKAQYKKTTGTDLDPHGYLDRVDFFGIPGQEFKTADGNTVNSTQFMVDASIAYWMGRCRPQVLSLTETNYSGPKECTRYQDPDGDKFKTRSRCITQCIRGSTDGWEARHEWYMRARECFLNQ